MTAEALTERETQVVALLVAGERITAIGRVMHMAPSTVSTYIWRAKVKMRARTTAQLAAKYATGER